MTDTSVCPICNKEKSISEFYNRKKERRCKQCVHEWYLQNKKHVHEIQKQYKKTHKEELKERRRLHPEWNHNYYINHKEKYGVKT
jgi:hypothetical protein